MQIQGKRDIVEQIVVATLTALFVGLVELGLWEAKERRKKQQDEEE